MQASLKPTQGGGFNPEFHQALTLDWQALMNGAAAATPVMEEVVMLVLSRKVGEQLVIGDNIRVVIHRVAGNRVTIGIEAPNDVRIIRGELQAHDQTFEIEQEEAFAGRLVRGTAATATLPRRSAR